jgi:hypothetical protein
MADEPAIIVLTVTVPTLVLVTAQFTAIVGTVPAIAVSNSAAKNILKRNIFFILAQGLVTALKGNASRASNSHAIS